MTPAPAGMGIPTKYFFPGRPGFEGWGLVVILKRARRLAPAIKKQKTGDRAQLHQLAEQFPEASVGN